MSGWNLHGADIRVHHLETYGITYLSTSDYYTGNFAGADLSGATISTVPHFISHNSQAQSESFMDTDFYQSDFSKANFSNAVFAESNSV